MSEHDSHDIEALLRFRHDTQQPPSSGTSMQLKKLSEFTNSSSQDKVNGSQTQGPLDDSSSLQKLMQNRSDKLSQEAAKYLKTSASQVHRLSPGTSSNEENDVHDISNSSVSEGSPKHSSAQETSRTGKKRKYKSKSKSGSSKSAKSDGSEKPKRPLSAYNFFFRDERARIISGSSTGGKDSEEVEKAPKSNRIYPKGKAPHRKITFEKLGKLIAERWKSLSDDERAVFNKMAEEDSSRYRGEMQKFYERENAKRRAKYFPGMSGTDLNQMDDPVNATLKPEVNGGGAAVAQPQAAASSVPQQGNVIFSPAHAFASLVQQTLQQAPNLMQQGVMNSNGAQSQGTNNGWPAQNNGNSMTQMNGANYGNQGSGTSLPYNMPMSNSGSSSQMQGQPNSAGSFMQPQNQQPQMQQQPQQSAQNNLLSLFLQQNFGQQQQQQQQQSQANNNLLGQLLCQQNQQNPQQQQQGQQHLQQQQNPQQGQQQNQQHSQQQQKQQQFYQQNFQPQQQQQQHQQNQQAGPQQNEQQSNIANFLMQLAAGFGGNGQVNA